MLDLIRDLFLAEQMPSNDAPHAAPLPVNDTQGINRMEGYRD